VIVSATALQKRIARKGANLDRVAGGVIKQPNLIPELLEGLNSDTARVRYGCLKVLKRISEKEPEALYPEMGSIIGLLDHENTFVLCDACRIIANLTPVDRRGKFEKVFRRYFAPIPGPALIPAVTVLSSASTIAQAKPKLTRRIVAEMLKVDKARYPTAECRRIALGHAIDSLDRFFDQIENREPVLRLVRKQLRSPRPSTKKKAQRFLTKHDL
jgi:hypothetical protein